MSWQAYVDTSLVGTGHIDKAAIISAAGDSAWATSSGFTVKPEEMKVIADIIEGKPGAADKAFAEGFHVAGERYVVTKIEDRSLYGRLGRTGVCIVKTKLAIIVGHYGESTQVGNAATTVESLADYMVGLNY